MRFAMNVATPFCCFVFLCILCSHSCIVHSHVACTFVLFIRMLQDEIVLVLCVGCIPIWHHFFSMLRSNEMDNQHTRTQCMDTHHKPTQSAWTHITNQRIAHGHTSQNSAQRMDTHVLSGRFLCYVFFSFLYIYPTVYNIYTIYIYISVFWKMLILLR